MRTISFELQTSLRPSSCRSSLVRRRWRGSALTGTTATGKVAAGALFAMAVLCELTPAPAAADVEGVLSVDAYGYSVTVWVNGVDIGVTSGMSGGHRLFSVDHEIVATMDAETRQQQAVLKPGANAIAVDYERQPDADPLDKLEVSFVAKGYPAPLFFLFSRKPGPGRVHDKIEIAERMPDGFRPVFYADGKRGGVALLTLESEGVTARPRLNDTEAMTLGGMKGTVVLEGMRSGKNELQVDFEGAPGGEVKFCTATPNGFQSVTRRLDAEGAYTEKVTFVVP